MFRNLVAGHKMINTIGNHMQKHLPILLRGSTTGKTVSQLTVDKWLHKPGQSALEKLGRMEISSE